MKKAELEKEKEEKWKSIKNIPEIEERIKEALIFSHDVRETSTRLKMPLDSVLTHFYEQCCDDYKDYGDYEREGVFIEDEDIFNKRTLAIVRKCLSSHVNAAFNVSTRPLGDEEIDYLKKLVYDLRYDKVWRVYQLDSDVFKNSSYFLYGIFADYVERFVFVFKDKIVLFRDFFKLMGVYNEGDSNTIQNRKIVDFMRNFNFETFSCKKYLEENYL